MEDTYTPKTTFEKKRDIIEKTLTDDEINALLTDYVEIEDINDAELDTHIRYFTIIVENGKASKIFRLGGKLHSISPDNDYVMLKHGNNMMQVPIRTSIFFKELSVEEIKTEYESLLDKYEDEIIELKILNKKLFLKMTGGDDTMKTKRNKPVKENTKITYIEDDYNMNRSERKLTKMRASNSIRTEITETKKQFRL